MDKKTLIDMNLKNDFKEFCKSQESCNKCELVEKELINSGYDQPCEEVYRLLRIIQDK